MRIRFAAALAPSLFLMSCGTSSVVPPDLGTELDLGTSADAGSTDAGCRSDLECSDRLFCNGAERCNRGVCEAAAAGPCVRRSCNEAQDTCATVCVDADEDGSCADVDCDDQNRARYPGALERCDAIDNDCNPATVGPDEDGDTFPSIQCCNPQSSGMPLCGTDCNDARATINPTAVESCNGVDDDCDGMVDDGVTTALWPDLDGDGYGDASPSAVSIQGCAGTPGRVELRGDCDETAPARHAGAPEACNAIDDDCDGLVDDIQDGVVACMQGQTRTCMTSCGNVRGTQTCAADCSAFSLCRAAAEVCNGCDDDLDGAPDNGFSCVRNSVVPCMNAACGTQGTRSCGATCTLGTTCVVTEVCNYCDDNGTNGISEELVLANVSERRISLYAGATPRTSVRYAGGARLMTVPSPAGSGGDVDRVVQLLDGSNQNQAGAYWIDLDRVVSWGPVVIEAELQVRTLGGFFPMGGWAVIISTGGTGDVGRPQDQGVPTTRTGTRVDWIWGAINPALPWNNMGEPTSGDFGGDWLGYAALPSNWRGQVNFINLYGWRTASPGLGESAPTSFLTQKMTIRYQPENPYTAAREERMEITPAGGGGATYVIDNAADTADPNNDLPLGSRISIGFTAGSWTYNWTPPGAPMQQQFGARVEARLILERNIPAVANPPRAASVERRTNLSRDQVCAGAY